MSPRQLLRVTFVKVVALIYTAGTLAQLLRLVFRFDWKDMPFFPDWALVILGRLGSWG